MITKLVIYGVINLWIFLVFLIGQLIKFNRSLIVCINSCKTTKIVDFSIVKYHYKLNGSHHMLICKLHNIWIGIDHLLYFVSCFCMQGSRLFVMLKIVLLFMWNDSTHLSSSDFVKINLHNQVVLLAFT
jgi:hypothetical protein